MDKSLWMDRDYLRDVTRIGLPIVLQNFIFNGLALVDNILIGGLGSAPIAALGIANRLGFIFALLLFGIHSGANMFGAQFWGKRDLDAVRKVLGIALATGAAASFLFLLIAQLVPEAFMRFFIRDEEVVALGASFLRIVSWSYLFQAVTSAYAIQSRGVGRTGPPPSGKCHRARTEHCARVHAHIWKTRFANAGYPWCGNGTVGCQDP